MFLDGRRLLYLCKEEIYRASAWEVIALLSLSHLLLKRAGDVEACGKEVVYLDALGYSLLLLCYLTICFSWSYPEKAWTALWRLVSTVCNIQAPWSALENHRIWI